MNLKKILILLILTHYFVFAFDSVEVLNPNITVHKSGYFKTDKDLTPQEALYQNFIELPQKAKSFGFDTNTYWFMFEVTIKGEKPYFFLETKDPLVQLSTMYVFQKNQLLYSKISGYTIPIEARPIKQFPIRFELISSNTKTTYLIKIVSQYPIYASYTFGDQYELDKSYSVSYIIIILSIGIFSVMFFYNIFLYFVIKDKAYIFYTLYIFGYFMITILAQGYVTLISDDLLVFTPLLISFFLQIKLIGLAFFTIYFLNLAKTFPFLEQTILYLLYANIIASFTVPFASEVQILSMIFMNGLYLILIYVGFKSYFTGYKPALYYLIATGMALISIIIYSFMNQGVFLSFNVYSYNLMTFGLIWDILFLSLALAYRIKLLQEEKDKNQKLALIKSKETSLGEFSGNIAHQWRQPLAELSSILVNSEAKLRFSTIEKEELLKQFDLSSKILKHLSSTIDTFQGFFQNERIETTFCVNDEIKRCIEFVNDSMKNNGINITFTEEKEFYLIGKANEFSQIILNIVLNAKDMFCQRNIQNREIKIYIKSFKKGFKIEISDNAGGIEIKPIESIFESYITSKDKGIGIGLFIVKTIVEQKFNGKIQVINDKNRADETLFLLIFP